MSKSVLADFRERVLVEDFLTWNQYKKFEYFIERKCPIYVAIRHTKHWLASCLTFPEQSCYIKVNLDDLNIYKEEGGEFSLDYFNKILSITLSHELIHYFQDCENMEDRLSEREKRKLVLCGNAFKSKRNKFLYATNWIEMDAELGSWCIYNNFRLPTLDEVIEHYKMFYPDEKISEIAGNYVYDYFFRGKKNLDFRDKIFDRDREAMKVITAK